METFFRLPGSRTRAVVTIGSFDGVHRGHVQLLQRTIAEAHAQDAAAVCITFDPHPRAVIDGAHAPAMLSTVAERTDLMAALGVDQMVVLPFSRQFSQITAEEFVAQLLRAYDLKMVVAGPTFSIGKGGKGDLEFIHNSGTENGFRVVEVPAVDDSGVISSQRIRYAVLDGDLSSAARWLGRPYTITSLVETGERRGRGLGFPTANLHLPANKLLPPPGIYAGRVNADGTWLPAAIALGFRPTFQGTGLKLEAAILDFDGDLYGRTVQLEWTELLRDEQKFDSAEALAEQMKIDVAMTRDVINKAPAWTGN